MKVLVIGGTGVLGSAVVKLLQAQHQVLSAGKKSGDFQVDITDEASVTALFAQTGSVDAIIATVGNVAFAPVTEMTTEQFNLGLQDKLLGQIRLALLGQHILCDGGSITLTSGIVAEEPIRQGSNTTTVNLAVEGFVHAASLELPRGLRINAVSPTLLAESVAAYGPFFPGFESVSAARTALAYLRSVEGPENGRVFRVR